MPTIESAIADPMYFVVLGLAAGYACLGCIVLYGVLSSKGKAREERLRELRAARDAKRLSSRNRFAGDDVRKAHADTEEIRLLRSELAKFIKVSASITNDSQNLHLEVAALRMRVETLENDLAEHLEVHNQLDSINPNVNQASEPSAKNDSPPLNSNTAAKSTNASSMPTTIALIHPTPTESHGETRDENGIPIRQHEELGLLYMSRPKSPDDLTQIWGIGSNRQTDLQEHGIFYHHQIAAWTPEQIGHFDNWMNLGGRIHRELWVPQAIRLTRQNAGKKASKKKQKRRQRRAA
ncbi:iron-sulfur cluster transporter [Rhodopirellula europaea]|uniref:Iron-sulfur cluster transporter n=1 Tax=Rhodopirellula europaea 6C TaxID=1263867 RepID=M2AIF1_9BACT|nr:iron-sulfur cluster transporter [Rhodopirellula europaea]EMB16925.1 iron-sulfur cluster transporter [Rhodopirellula europaea 6C]